MSANSKLAFQINHDDPEMVELKTYGERRSIVWGLVHLDFFTHNNLTSLFEEIGRSDGEPVEIEIKLAPKGNDIVSTSSSNLMIYGTISRSGHKYCPNCTECYNPEEKLAALLIPLVCDNCRKASNLPVPLHSLDQMPEKINIIY